ncbi:MAG: YafY family protein [Candidatus Geothermincolales bacterium]
MAELEKFSKLWRIIKLFTLIEGNPGVKAKDLAERCEVSIRTIYRDIQLMKLAGIPLYYDDGYRIAEGFFLPPLQLDLMETLSLLMGAELLARQKGTPFQRGIESAVQKIYASLPAGLREEARRESARFSPAWQPAVDYQRRLSILEVLEEAIEEKRSVRIDYRAMSTGECTERLVDPYGFLFRSNGWYLVAHCHLRGEIKIFKVDRILDAVITGDRFEVPEDFNIREYMGEAWQLMRGERVYQVAIQFPPHVAPFVTECIWHFSQTCEPREDGSVILRFRVSGLEELANWLLGFGGDARVQEPRELEDLLVEKASRVLQVYRR